jgi:hypothetical protein
MNIRCVSDQLDGSAFGTFPAGDSAITKSQRRHIQMSTALPVRRDLLITMVIPHTGQILSRGRLLGVAIARDCATRPDGSV